jgi:ABC-type Fe3+/spermidine/putrescine transport system ATPase subunit
VVLLDEPLSALDEQLRQEMQSELKAIQAQVGRTFVCVTHHQAEALAMSDRVAVMDQGRILQVGRPEEIYESPANLFVARFVGASNELHGTLTERRDGEGVVQPSRSGELRPLRVPVRSGVARGAEVTFLIRPERVRILPPDTPPTGDNRLTGRIDRRLYAGDRLHYFVRVSDSVLWRVDVANGTGSPIPLPVGARVCVAWNPSDGDLFRA